MLCVLNRPVRCSERCGIINPRRMHKFII
jgi:hypothetical protein